MTESRTNTKIATSFVRHEDELRRYINIPALIYLLSQRKLTLLNPDRWDDKNDSHFLRVYCRIQRFRTVRAACFTRAAERYHHWRVFTAGDSGACVVFDNAALFQAVDVYDGIRRGDVDYLTLKQLAAANLKAHQLPFRKRQAFEAEREYRIILEARESLDEALDIDIPLQAVRRVLINPWLPERLYAPLKHH